MTGRYDAPSGRCLHDATTFDELLQRIDQVRERDLNAIQRRR
jgi:hypothetical protein